MNILILGLGSIGQRHLRNLKLIEPKSNFYTIRKKKNVLLFYKLPYYSYGCCNLVYAPI